MMFIALGMISLPQSYVSPKESVKYVQLPFNGRAKSVTFDYSQQSLYPIEQIATSEQEGPDCFIFDDFVFGLGNFVAGN